MANPIGYNGSDIHTTHPGFWFDDGYVGVGADGYTILTYSTNVTNSPGGVQLALAPNTILKSIVHSGTGVWTFTFKETWPAMLMPKFTTVCPTGYRGMQMVSSTIGQSSASNVVTPVVVVQVNTSGTASELPAFGGFFWEFVMQTSTAYL